MTKDSTQLSATALGRLGAAAWSRGDRAEWRACVRELERRGTRAAKTASESLKSLSGRAPRASRAAGPSPRWVARVARIAREFASDDDGHHSVYVVLLDRDGGPGLYVGLTGQTVKERFAEHKRGVRAGRGYVRDYGVRLLEGVGAHLRASLSYARAKLIERRLKERLEEEGFDVKGGH